ncbi:MAG: type IV secretory system conjugative DNA transfer family protein [Defluviitaleaceae bacterium]|nr:type IV secretory system conjugative DNA transfer family protein [Defluviitaleaceae bacterium]MCL2247030.1 type IV secretory system conjugative DNA transfer family protein [Lentimicrobiaceae bacterium]
MASKKNIKKLFDKYTVSQTSLRDRFNIPHYMLNKRSQDSFFFFGIEKQVVTERMAFREFIDGRIRYVGKPQEKDGHVLVVGGAGSGKSSCIAIPSLETWKGTIFAIDIKGELSEHWNNIPSPKRDFKIFNFSKEESYSRYDPFYFLRQSEEEDLIQNAREISQAIIQVPPSVLEPFWLQAAQHVLTATILYGYGNNLSFIETMQLIQTRPIWKLIEDIANSNNEYAKMHINQFIESDFVKETFDLEGIDLELFSGEDISSLKPKLINLSELSDSKMLAGISAELSSKIMVFATDPRIKSSFSPSDMSIRWEDLETHNVFMRIAEDKLGQWDGAITLMLTQLIRTLERRPDKYSTEGKKKKLPPILLLLDEFPRLGKVDVIQNAISTLRSKGVTICLTIQSLAQLDKTYGRDTRRIIVDNCQYKAILGVTDSENQKIFSEMVGSIVAGKSGVGVDNDKKTNIITCNSMNHVSH